MWIPSWASLALGKALSCESVTHLLHCAAPVGCFRTRGVRPQLEGVRCKNAEVLIALTKRQDSDAMSTVTRVLGVPLP